MSKLGRVWTGTSVGSLKKSSWYPQKSCHHVNADDADEEDEHEDHNAKMTSMTGSSGQLKGYELVPLGSKNYSWSLWGDQLSIDSWQLTIGGLWVGPTGAPLVPPGINGQLSIDSWQLGDMSWSQPTGVKNCSWSLRGLFKRWPGTKLHSKQNSIGRPLMNDDDDYKGNGGKQLATFVEVFEIIIQGW